MNLPGRVRYFWYRYGPSRRKRVLLVRYAVLGVLAANGPSTSAEVARILRRRPGGTLMDLAVMERVWGQVASEWADEPQPRRRLYRLSNAASSNSVQSYPREAPK